MKKNYLDKYGPWALVTGASSGIGKKIATELAARGLNVVIVARRQNLLDKLKQALTQKHAIQVRTIQANLTEADAVKHIEDATQDIDIGLVVPNAGAEVARIGLNALGRKATVVPELLNKLYVWENRLIPRTWPVALFGFMIRRAIKREAQPAHEAAATTG